MRYFAYLLYVASVIFLAISAFVGCSSMQKLIAHWPQQDAVVLDNNYIIKERIYIRGK